MNTLPSDVLFSVKKYLAAGIPSMFGFFGFPSFNDTDGKRWNPLPRSQRTGNMGPYSRCCRI
ncbi:hypothetical protein [Methanosarcina barkeri]|uniref:hypothetical protein n=1 Tax=Methanosarcina barkeri TaxID=2208 RepID=UPI001E36571F|nr:hypothetical protein [Methanosarcina barkeri]